MTGTTKHTNHIDIINSILEGPKVARNWTFSATGSGSYSYNPTFSWDNADEEDGFEYNAAILAKYNESAWSYPTMSDMTSASATATKLTSFGDFQIGSEDMTPDARKSSIEADRISDVIANNTDAASITITVRNANGNLVGAGVEVFLHVLGGNVGEGGLNPSGSWKTNAEGKVEVNLTSTVANKVEIMAYLGTDEEGELIGDGETSSNVEVTFKSGLTSHIAILTQPAGQASGSVLTTQPVIHLLDANNNIVTDDNTTEVTVSITSGEGGTLGGTLNVKADSGLVTFGGLTLSGIIGEVYKFTFASEGTTVAVSEDIKLNSHGFVAQIVLSGLATDLFSGDSRQLTATLKDVAGNVIDTGIESSLEITISRSAELGSVSAVDNITAETGVALITIIGEKAGQVTIITSTESPALRDEFTLVITVDKTALQMAVTGMKDFVETDWSVNSWAALHVAIANAQAALEDIHSRQSEINEMLVLLDTAITNLSVDKSALQMTVTGTEDFVEKDWSVDSWIVLQTAIVDAQTLLDDTDSRQSEIDVALNELNVALGELNVDKTALQAAALIAEAKIESDYSTVSWVQFLTVLRDVQAILDDNDAVQSEIDAKINLLNSAIAGLTVDIAALQIMVTEMESLIETDWSADSWDVLLTAIADAQTVLGDTKAIQSEIDAMLLKLSSAIELLNVDKIALWTRITETEAFSENDWSVDSWTNLQTTIANAQAALEDLHSRQSEINEILTLLNAAIVHLTVDKTALQTIVFVTEDFVETDWSVDSWTALQIAVEDAKAFLNDINSRQSEIDDALTELNVAIGGLNVDKTALQAAALLAEAKIESDYSTVSWAQFLTVLRDVQAILDDNDAVQSEIDAKINPLNVAISRLTVDKTALQMTLNETEGFVETDWSVDSWASLQVTIVGAQTLLDDTNPKQSEMNSILVLLNMAISRLTVDKSALQMTVTGTEDFVEKNWSVASWTSLQAAIVDARTILDDTDPKQFEIDEILTLLNTAIANLTVDKAALQLILNETESFIETDWSVGSWASLQIAVADAKAFLNDINSMQSEIDDALIELNVALGELNVDKTALQAAALIAEAKIESDYSTVSWSQFLAALRDVQAILDGNDAVQSEIDARINLLNSATAGLTVDIAALQIMVTEMESLIETDWSADSWDVLLTAIADAQTVLGDTKATQSEIDAMLLKLSSAIELLNVDKIALWTRITETEAFSENDWSVDSWTNLQTAIANAQAALEDIHSRQSEINEILTLLDTAIARLTVYKTALQTTLNETEGFIETDWSVDSWTALQIAVADAKAFLNDINSKQADIDAMLLKLSSAIELLNVDKVALSERISETEDFIETDWSVDSWSTLQAIIVDAQTLLDDNDSKQSEINSFLDLLNRSVIDLEVDKTALQTMLNEAEGFLETDWSVDSWKALQIVVTAAKPVFDNTKSRQSDVNSILAELKKAIDILSVDRMALWMLVAVAQEVIETDWSVDSWKVLQIVITESQAVLDNAIANQLQINAVLDLLNSAIADLEVDKNTLQIMVTGTENLIETDWSVNSWKVLKNSVIESQLVLDDPNAIQSEINTLLAAINTAIAGLESAVSNIVGVIEDDLPVLESAYGTAFEDIGSLDKLPLSLVVSLSSGDTERVEVRWEAGDYNPAVIGEHTIFGKLILPAEAVFANVDDLKAKVKVTVKPKNIRITATVQSKIYGEDDPVLTYTLSPELVGNDTLRGDLERETGENVGEYAIGRGTLTLSDNYDLVFVPGQLQILPSKIEGIVFEGKVVIYNGLSNTLEARGLPENASVVYRNNGHSIAGSYIVTATISMLNHDDLVLTAILTIQKAQALIEAEEIQEHGYNGTSKNILAKLTHGETKITYGPQQGYMKAGIYNIIVSAAETTNYLAVSKLVSLVIRQGNLIEKPVLEDRTVTYDGKAHSLEVKRIQPGTNLTYENNDQVNVGSYEVTVNVTHPDYGSETLTATLTIKKATQRIQFKEIGKVLRDVGHVELDVSSDSGLPASLNSSDELVATIAGRDLLIHRLGTTRITATQEGDVNYEAAEPAEITVKVEDAKGEESVYVHRALSPNGDGINDFLIVEGIRDFPENRLQVLTPNQLVVFDIEGYNNDSRAFRGISNTRGSGGLLPEGTYFYVVRYNTSSGWKMEKGWFVLKVRR